MATLNDIMNLIYKAKSSGKLLEYKIIEDSGDKIVYNFTFVRDDDTVYSKTSILRIVNRGSADEKVFWVSARPTELYDVDKPVSIAEQKKDDVINYLKTNKNLSIIESVSVNSENSTVTVVGYIPGQTDGTLVKKTFLAEVKSDGTFNVYEVQNSS